MNTERPARDSGNRVRDGIITSRECGSQQPPHSPGQAPSRYSVYTHNVAAPRRSYFPAGSTATDYMPLHLAPTSTAPQYIHTCPSCRGTLGSAASSSSSYFGSRSETGRSVDTDRSYDPGRSFNMRSYDQGRSFNMRRSYDPGRLHDQGRSCDPRLELIPSDTATHCSHILEYSDHNTKAKSMPAFTFQPPFTSSSYLNFTSSHTRVYPSEPTAHPCTCSYHLHSSSSSSSSVCGHQPAHLYIPLSYWESGPKSQLRCSSQVNADLLLQQVAVRAASTAATCGSSSSDTNPNETMGECLCCKNSCSLATMGGSNKSTYGSAQNRDSVDISSFDSNDYCRKSSFSSSDEKVNNYNAINFQAAPFSQGYKKRNGRNNSSFSRSSKSFKRKCTLSNKGQVSDQREVNKRSSSEAVRMLTLGDSVSSLCLSDVSTGSCSWESCSSSSPELCGCNSRGHSLGGDASKVVACGGDCASGCFKGGGEDVAPHTSGTDVCQQQSHRWSQSFQQTSQRCSLHFDDIHRDLCPTKIHTASSCISNCRWHTLSLSSLKHNHILSPVEDSRHHESHHGVMCATLAANPHKGSSDPSSISSQASQHLYRESSAFTNCKTQCSEPVHKCSPQSCHTERSADHCSCGVQSGITSHNFHLVNQCSICQKRYCVPSQPALLGPVTSPASDLECQECNRRSEADFASHNHAPSSSQSMVLFSEAEGKQPT